jgi:hypothetical protein
LVTYANTVPTLGSDGLPYATAAALPATEADLYNQSPAVPAGAPPVPVLYAQSVLAVVTFVVAGGAGAANYVCLQSDLGDGVWYDVATCQVGSSAGTFYYVLGSGQGGNTGFQQSRGSGTAPGAGVTARTGALGGRLRFTGQAANAATVTVTVNYRLTGLR